MPSSPPRCLRKSCRESLSFCDLPPRGSNEDFAGSAAVSVGRRKVRLEEQERWIFNRMVEAYAARPAYPEALVRAIAGLCPVGARVLDLGAGLGHLAIPLAQRGFDVTAVEPAGLMLEQLGRSAREQGVAVTEVHAQAEDLPLEAAAFDLVVVADALHFMDRERAGSEVARVMTSRGTLALLTCELGRSPFMDALKALMRQCAPRRARDVSDAVAELLALAGVHALPVLELQDDTAVTWKRLESILGSISFIGPAMNRERTVDFQRRLRSIQLAPRWTRTLTLSAGSR